MLLINGAVILEIKTLIAKKNLIKGLEDKMRLSPGK